MLPAFPAIALVRRELLSTLREGRAYAMMILTVAVCFAAILLFIQDGGGNMAPGYAVDLFKAFTVILLCCGGLFSMTVGALAICVEKEQDTWDLLSVTLVRPWGIVAAKLVNATGMFFLVCIAAAPMFGVLFFFVGVDWMLFAQAAVIFVLTALGSACIGLAASARCRRPMAALFLALFLEVTYFGLWPGLVLAFAAVTRWSWLELVLYLSASMWSPVCALLIGWELDFTAFTRETVWILGYHGFWIGAGYFLAWHWMQRVKARVPSEEAPMPRGYWINRHLPFRPIPDRCNPMEEKELTLSALYRGTLRNWLAAGTFLAALIWAGTIVSNYRSWYASQDALPIEPLLVATIGAQLAMWLLLAIPAAAAIARERDLGNSDLLRCTLLTPREVLRGKLMPLLRFGASCALVAYVPLVIVFLASFRMQPWLYTAGLAVNVSLGMLDIIFLSVLAAVHSRRTVSAVAGGLFLSLLVVFFVPLGVSGFFDVFRYSFRSALLPAYRDTLVYSTSPAVAPAFLAYAPPRAGIWLAVTALHAGLAYGWWRLTAWAYARQWRDR